ncbi:hypothetical protein [Legionella tunisiensis]|uniref:hypothetical protein n=1 Tax=Legionella tunisiensis TaxID=1034944 RepID=UPI00035CF8DB|nr:hypothetical protein [Legionella tunisiensis]
MPNELVVNINKKHINGSGQMGSHFYSIIERICQQECDKLRLIHTEQTISRVTNIDKALNRLRMAIVLRQKIVNPNVKEITQVKNEENLSRLLDYDFSNIDTLLTFKSQTISWGDKKHAFIVMSIFLKVVWSFRYKMKMNMTIFMSITPTLRCKRLCKS